MFWRFSFGSINYVDELLSKDNVTFQSLIEADDCTVEDIVNEVKGYNRKLLNLITNRETITLLLRSLLEPAEAAQDAAESENLLKAKYTQVACELLCSENQEICDLVSKDAELMGLLCSFLEREPPLPNGLAGYFGRIFCTILFKSAPDVMQHLQDNPMVLRNLLKHSGSSSLAEVIIRIAASDEPWVAETDLVEALLDKLGPNHSADEQVRAAEVLCGINTDIFHFANPVKQKLYSVENIEKLCVCAFGSTDKIMVPAVMVFTNLLVGVGPASDHGVAPAEGPDPSSEAFRGPVVEAVLNNAGSMVSLLDVEDPEQAQEMPYGIVRPVFGIPRLRVIELLRVILWVAGAEVQEALVSSRALPKCLELFLRYPFNNLLHSSVEGLVTYSLEATPKLAESLVFNFDLPTFVATAEKEVTPEPLPNAEREPRPLRAGYIGHLTRIANKLLDQAKKDPSVDDALRANEKWAHYVQTTLDECNKSGDIFAWDCGRPEQEPSLDGGGMVPSLDGGVGMVQLM
eukprot:CAMPEP_0177623274 /NCGR_PEP_ID=MMETSP0419_2-20121207/28816_1 /TAXON_ID=582737 /ORGANISM="Tetraselmis sp., Strain GSL018" /LENGTH=516 /DNA_ID=CAMNT_0019123817 /DNA_START=213 /DNA_END=1763 /DNA_ORIENTATION=-